jgi:hypothetical protein
MQVHLQIIVLLIFIANEYSEKVPLLSSRPAKSKSPSSRESSAMAQVASRTPISNKRCTLEVPEDWRGLWSDGTARRCDQIARNDINSNRRCLSTVDAQRFKLLGSHSITLPPLSDECHGFYHSRLKI